MKFSRHAVSCTNFNFLFNDTQNIPTANPSQSPSSAPSKKPSSAPTSTPSQSSIEDRFIEETFVASVPSVAGSEAFEEYDVDFNVTYNRNGFVSLANTTVVDEVVCLPGQAKIRFSEVITPLKLPIMFPNSSVLIINGQLFGSECNFYLEPNRTSFNSSSLEENVGFMIIQSAHLGESALDVTIDGMIVTDNWCQPSYLLNGNTLRKAALTFF